MTILLQRRKMFRGQGSPNKEANPPKIWLGIGLKGVEGDLATYLAQAKACLSKASFRQPCREAKLQDGDIVLAFQGKKVSDPGALVEALHAVAPLETDPKGEGKTATYPHVTLTISRRGQEMKVELTPRPRPGNLKLSPR